MANVLKMDLINTIRTLKAQGWSKRRIARELEIDRQTVRRYLAEAVNSKSPTISTPGSESAQNQNHPFSIAGSDRDFNATVPSVVPSTSSANRPGRPSKCEPHARLIEGKLELGLSAQRIYQDLVCEVQFNGSYQAVKRFIRHATAGTSKPVYRLEVQPGEEAQVDFGTGAWVIDAEGKRRRPWVFRIVLSYSRKAYSEVVWQQTTESFIRCLENAFRHFQGVPKSLNLDNLKAAVSRADWYDPELNPKLSSFCRHYGTCLLPCRPYKAEHKGKVERGIGYVKANALKGRIFSSLAEENSHLAQWERTVADLRIHGTTRKQVAAMFVEEKAALLPLPPSLFACFMEAQRSVHRDSHVEVSRSYYRVPPEYIGCTVWARWDRHCVRIFNNRWEQIIVHAKLEPGKFTKPLGVGGGRGTLEHNLSYALKLAGELGQPCADWAQGLVQQRGPLAIRTLMGLVSLAHKYSFKALNQACACALSRGAWRLRDIRALMQHPQPAMQTHFEFARNHPLIRDLAEYGLFIKTNHTTQHEP